jgi:hypothetical protein
MLNYVKTFQHCQRNWDLTKLVTDETVNWLMEVGYSTPTKQNLNTFDIVCIKDRSVIQQFAKCARNPDYNYELLPDSIKKDLENGRLQNPQTDANLLFLFFTRPQERTSDIRQQREGGLPEELQKWRSNTNFEMGIAASAIGIAATSIGMRTGFCRCIFHDILPQDILDKYNLNKYNLEVMLGVGYPLYKNHASHNDGKKIHNSYKKIIDRKIII